MNFLKKVVNGAVQTTMSSLGFEERDFLPQLRHISRVTPSVDFEKGFVIRKQEVKIGRDVATADYVLDSTLHKNVISRTHAIISRNMTTVTKQDINTPNKKNADTFTIEDRSMNGIFVNGVKIPKKGTKIKHGDTIVFGGGYRTPVGTKSEQPDSELIFVFETVRDPGVNDQFQKKKPPKKQIAGGNIEATQAQEDEEEGATQTAGIDDEEGATQICEDEDDDEGPTQKQKDDDDEGETQIASEGDMIQQILAEVPAPRRIADVGDIDQDFKRARVKRQRSKEPVQPKETNPQKESEPKTNRVRKRRTR